MSLATLLLSNKASRDSTAAERLLSGVSAGTSLTDVTAAVQVKKSGAATSNSDGTVELSQAAIQAAAEKDDAAVEAGTLTTRLRAELDAQYATAGNDREPALGEMSRRALATVALNTSGSFSTLEAHTARAELRERDRSSLLEAIAASGLSAASLTAWQSARNERLAGMSAEEATLRVQDSRLLKS